MKYLGSKARLSKHLIKIIKPEKYDIYIEPFVGGANMLAAVDHPNRIGYDNNPYLIALLKQLQTDWELPYITREEYYKVKTQPQNYPMYYVGHLGFAASCCGVWLSGYAGITQTKNGQRDYMQEAINNLNQQRLKLPSSQVHFSCNPYWMIPRFTTNSSVVYCNPPYANTTGYLHEFDNKAFWDWAIKESKHRLVYVSEYDAPEPFVEIWSKSDKKSMNANSTKNPKKKDSIEKLFIHKDWINSL